jgi:hypothetical protein
MILNYDFTRKFAMVGEAYKTKRPSLPAWRERRSEGENCFE